MPFLRQIFVVTAFVSLFAVSGTAQDNGLSQPQEELVFPTAEEIIDRHIQAIGGYEMLASRKSIHFISAGHSSQGSTFDYEVYQAEGRFSSRFDFNDGSVIERGVYSNGKQDPDGKRLGHAWEIKNGGFREIVAEERQEYLRRRSSITSVTRLFSYYKSIEFGSSESIDGREAYKLIFTDHDGKEIERYYDAKTGLLTRQICHEAMSSGKTRVVRDFLEYERIGEFVVSKKQVISQDNGIQWVYQIKFYEVDEKIPRGTFALPSSISDSIAKSAANAKIQVAAGAPTIPVIDKPHRVNK